MTTVPGKVGWPVVGDTSYSFYKNPTGYIDKYMTQHSSRLFKTRFLNTPTVFVGSNRGVQDVLTESAGALDLGYKSFMHQVYGDNILFLNNEDSTEMRQCLSHLFCAESTQNYQSKIDQITARHLGNIDASQPLCVYSVVKQLATEICLSVFLDLDFQRSTELAQRIQRLTKTHWHGIISVPLPIKLPGSGNGTSFSKALEAKSLLLRIIQEKLSTKAGFVAALERLPFPQQADIDNHLLLFTSALVPKAIASLLTSFLTATGHHDQVSCQDGLLSDLDLMTSVLLEVQRLYPPFIGGRRLVRKRCTVDGHVVEEGQAIVYLTHSAHRDPAVFPDPEKFDPQRWTGRNANDKSKLFCFGAGPRGCVGQDFVMKIVQTVLSAFVEKFRWQLLEGQDLSPKWLPVSRPRDAVMVQLTRRNLELSA